jgi:hypothetical protein
MSGESSTRFAERVIGTLAGKQHGVVARWQLLQAGVTPHQIELRLATGACMKFIAACTSLGTPCRHLHAFEQAALLACGASAALSHRSAASMWELLPYPASAPPWVTIPPGRRITRPRIHIRRARVPQRDVRRRHGLRLTSPPRTILDLAALLDEAELERVVGEAEYRGLVSEAELKVRWRATREARYCEAPARTRPSGRASANAITWRTGDASAPPPSEHHGV